MKEAIVYIGIDVAKAHLDVAWAAHSRRFANSKSGRSALAKWIRGTRSMRRLIERIQKQIAMIDARIAALIAQNQDLSARAQKLTGIQGVGETHRCIAASANA